MENATLLKGVSIPEQGSIEVMITSAGEVVQTGKTVRYDGVDCYQPVGPELIGSAIPAVDAVEVCRCRECRYCDIGGNDVGAWCDCTIFAADVSEDGYCWLGRRREDGDA